MNPPDILVTAPPSTTEAGRPTVPPASTTAGPAVSPVAAPDAGRLGSALLDTTDLPGYAPMPSQASPVAGVGRGMTQCADQDDPAAIDSQAQAMFQAGPVGPFLGETLMAMSEADATALVRGLSQVTKNCGSFDGGSPGGLAFDISIGHLTFPRYGDDTAAFRMTATVERAGAALYAHVVAVRRGGLVLLVVLMQFDSPDVGSTENLVRRAYDKAGKI